MYSTLIGLLLAGGIPLLTFAAGYGAITSRIKSLEDETERMQKLLDKYVTREEFRALERRFDGMDRKLDRILESLMKAGHS